MANLEGYAGARVVITGGTGSFGSAMVRHLLEKPVSQITVVSRDEAKQDSMRVKFRDSRLRFFIGDVRDPDSLKVPFKGGDFVYHAAALKQVPTGEFFPMEAVKTNILGSSNVLEIASQSGIKKAVLLSTDKAVYPINAMGMTKSLMEKTALAFARVADEGKMLINVTRYGNVMLSRGSVIPLFVQQAKSGSNLTLTDPAMTRFMLTLEDSVSLVDYAFMEGRQGDTFVKKAPAARMGDLAQAIARILGVPAGRLVTIGTRHGEKDYEVLVSQEESRISKDLGDFYSIPMDGRDMNYESYFEKGVPANSKITQYDSNSTKLLSVDELEEMLMRLPGFRKLIDA